MKPAIVLATLLLIACSATDSASSTDDQARLVAPGSAAITPPSPVDKAGDAETSMDLDEARKQVAARFSGSTDEPTSKDAVWTASTIFKVAVYDDGSDRRGYAEYVCSVLYDYGFHGKQVLVHVIDYTQVLRNKKFVKLGDALCS